MAVGISCDGSFERLPRPRSWYGFVVRHGHTRRKHVLYREFREIGHRGSYGPDYAEVAAICYALMWVLKKRASEDFVMVASDHQGAVNAITRGWGMAPSVEPMARYGRYLLSRLPNVSLRWCPRNQNQAADRHIRKEKRKSTAQR